MVRGKPIFFIIILLALLFLAVLGLGQSRKETPPPSRLKIVATIFPLFDIVRSIAGDKAETILILPPGASPHTFELTPGKVKEISGARLVFKIGGLDDWIDKASESSPYVKKITVDRGIEFLASGEGEKTRDPHYWLAAKNGKIIARNIYEELVASDPGNKDYYFQNLENFLSSLDKADQEIKKELADIKNKKIIVFHDAWRYFAAEYSLEIAGVFEPSSGRGLAPRDLKNLTETAKKSGVKAIFSEPQFSVDALAPLAGDLGLEIYVLDPIAGVPGRESYIDLLRYNSQTFYQALK
jgi:zinc transport system substrate-binding protein